MAPTGERAGPHPKDGGAAQCRRLPRRDSPEELAPRPAPQPPNFARRPASSSTSAFTTSATPTPSWLLAGGSDLKSVMDRMGHAQIITTQRYLHTPPTPTRRISTPSSASAARTPGRLPEANLGVRQPSDADLACRATRGPRGRLMRLGWPRSLDIDDACWIRLPTPTAPRSLKALRDAGRLLGLVSPRRA